MALDYSIETCNKLRDRIENQHLLKPKKPLRYEVGDELGYEMTGIDGKASASVKLLIERFVGGGFAGQVYKVRVISIENQSGAVNELGGIKIDGIYAMKILIPPSGFSVLFRNFVYFLGFQSSFQLQVNPEAARAGAIWQKFIRRAARIKFGDETCINDIHVTFVDHDLGSCGELSDWVDGRTWRLEVDENLDTLGRWKRGKPVDDSKLGSAEYRAKKKFMDDLVSMLHEMGAHEFARQYEWSTCKSQPNCLKRYGHEDDPAAGLIAVDFRAGLALLPFLPMSPGDFKLILNGICRGSLVQFDRGNLKKLESFMDKHPEEFRDIRYLFSELKKCEKVYRSSQLDITHNLFRFFDFKFWGSLRSANITGWRVRNIIDENGEHKLRSSWFKYFIFFLLGFIPFLGRFTRKISCHQQWASHYKSILTSWDYFKRAFRGRVYANILTWYRKGRITEVQAQKAAFSLKYYFAFKPMTFIPLIGLQRFITDSQFRKDKLYFMFVRPFKLYFHHELREQWMLDMLEEGKKKHILTDEDAAAIQEHMKEPYIQKYLLSLVVHVMTLPVTQIVSVIIAGLYYWMHPDMDPTERSLKVGGILVLFQVIPISPGSFCRGAYTTYMAIKDRSFKDYNIALFLSYFKYIGYLAFPIQMTYHYPAISRFMAGHWATDAVHVVPVFGERGALLENWVFCLFYNWPLTLRRRISRRLEERTTREARWWHIPIVTVLGAAILILAHRYFLQQSIIPGREENLWLLKKYLWLAIFVSLACGALITIFARGASVVQRFIYTGIGGLATGILLTVGAVIVEKQANLENIAWLAPLIWRGFALTVLTVIGMCITELLWPDPDLKKID